MFSQLNHCFVILTLLKKGASSPLTKIINPTHLTVFQKLKINKVIL